MFSDGFLRRMIFVNVLVLLVSCGWISASVDSDKIVVIPAPRQVYSWHWAGSQRF